ncbi:hypothetical protein HBN50_05830 [Halobacteriovorax sp. GB3]|uniref:hypothetical protein n=1 Tax=Halobacteriovorax sp. GB3 TaxID=2719615 RepID=UPI00236278DF|nr:hypothetical protein [Halobacteriovorax sp. GB3]MDD0852605.1 hypothetical protein [Halobacteriovorax sp. GB3]
MAYSDLKKLKKVDVKESEVIFVRNLVVGNDAFAVKTFLDLKEKLGEEVKLLTNTELTKEHLRIKGPSSIRGLSNINYIKDNFSEYVLSEASDMPVFFKDLKLKDFGGRSKSETLLWDEEYYSTPALHFDYDKYFSFLRDEELIKKINEESFNNLITHTKQIEPEDLVENAHHEVECANGTIYRVENLYWAMGPEFYKECYKNMNQLSDSFIEFCESTATPCSLFIKLVFDKPITDLEKTLFIPLSYTHDWGHFIGDFQEEEGSQVVEFLHFVDKNSTSEEDLSRKIRNLKKNLEKIFATSKDVSFKEFITLTENTMSLKIDDSIYAQTKGENKNLTFISFNAPLEVSLKEDGSIADSCEFLTHFARALKGQEELAKILS